MPKPIIVVTGDKELDMVLSAMLPKEVKKAMRKATRSIAKQQKELAKRTTGKRSGLLRRSLTVRALKRSRTRLGHKVIHNPKKFPKGKYYGFAEEYGTRHREANPAIRMALKRMEPVSQDIYAREFKAALRAVTRGITI